MTIQRLERPWGVRQILASCDRTNPLAETRRRAPVVFDAELRSLTETTISELREIFRTQQTPPPTLHKSRCRSCSLHELCRPEAAARPAAAWRRRALDRLLGESGAAS